MRLFLLFSLLAISAMAVWASSSSAQDREAMERRGEALVSQHCAMCHAIGRSGGSPNSVAPTFRTLEHRYKLESLEEALGEGIMTGHPEMPEFAFASHDVGAIIAYFRSIQER
jgi:cytochrome c